MTTGDNIEVSIVVIRPDIAETQRKEQFLDDLRHFCDQNHLKILKIRETTITLDQIKSHYLTPGKLEEMGGKIIKSIQLARRDVNLLRKKGLDPANLKALGERLMEIEARTTVGKEKVYVVIAGPNAISVLFSARGSTDPNQTKPDSFRGRYGYGTSPADVVLQEITVANIVHIPETKEEVIHDFIELGEADYDSFIKQYK